MLDLRMEVSGIAQVDRKLSRLSVQMTKLDPAFRDIRAAFKRYQVKEFASQGAHGGLAWAQLSEKYRRWKARHYPGRKILALTGALRESMTSELESALLPTKLVMWSYEETAKWHDEGAGNLPVRKIVAIPESEKRDFTRILQRRIMAGVS